MGARQLFSNLHHYIKDYQGNIRSVVRQDVVVVEVSFAYQKLWQKIFKIKKYRFGK